MSIGKDNYAIVLDYLPYGYPLEGKMRPLVQEICAKHNLPYRQENVCRRLRMSLDLMVGKTNLLVMEKVQTAEQLQT